MTSRWFSLNRLYCQHFCRNLFRDQKAAELLKQLLPQFAKEGVSPEILERFSVSFRSGWKNWRDKDPDNLLYGRIFWDTRCGVRLEFEGQTIAGIGFDPEGRAVIIRQIQGCRGCDNCLVLVRWERLLVTLLTRLMSRSKWYREVGVITASQSEYYRGRESTFKQRYDGTARKLKFSFSAERQLWLQPLKV